MTSFLKILLALSVVGVIAQSIVGGGSAATKAAATEAAPTAAVSPMPAPELLPQVQNSARLNGCLAAKDCAFLLAGGGTSTPEMQLWVLKSAWKRFSTSDKENVKAVLKQHIAAAHESPAEYAASKTFGAGIPSSAPAFNFIVSNILKTRGWAVILCPSKNSRGSLVQGSESSDSLYSI